MGGVGTLTRAGASTSGLEVPAWRATVVLPLLAVLARLPLLTAAGRTDEVGYLLVARHAHAGGPFLYGDLWVDRPPLLIGVFRLAAALGGLPALRVLGLGVVAVLVVAAVDVGRTLSGPRGALWAGATAAALQASPLLGAPEVDGELLGAALVMVAVAVGLRALALPMRGRCVGLTVLSGALAAASLLVKQNLADGLVLLGVLLLVRLLRRREPAAQVLARLDALTAGALVPLGLAVAWSAVWGAGPGRLWTDVYAFRAAALPVLAATPSPGDTGRTLLLLVAAAGAGVVPLLGGLAWSTWRRRSASAPSVAVLVAGLFGAASVAGGVSAWNHYLMQLVPAAAAAAGLLASGGPRSRRWSAAVVAASVVSSLTASTVLLISHPGCGQQEVVGRRVSTVLRAHAAAGDSAVTLYGDVDALGDTGLRLPYPYLWSLPVRTLDPSLTRLTAVLTGPSRADWVVRTMPLHRWGLDADRRLERALALGYTPVAQVCGEQILHRQAQLSGPG